MYLPREGTYWALSIRSRTSSTPVFEAASISSRSMWRPASMAEQVAHSPQGSALVPRSPVQRFGEDARDGGLADAAGAGEQEGVVHAPGFQRWSAPGPRVPTSSAKRLGRHLRAGRGTTCGHSAMRMPQARRHRGRCGTEGRRPPAGLGTRIDRYRCCLPALAGFRSSVAGADGATQGLRAHRAGIWRRGIRTPKRGRQHSSGRAPSTTRTPLRTALPARLQKQARSTARPRPGQRKAADSAFRPPADRAAAPVQRFPGSATRWPRARISPRLRRAAVVVEHAARNSSAGYSRSRSSGRCARDCRAARSRARRVRPRRRSTRAVQDRARVAGQTMLPGRRSAYAVCGQW